MSLKPLSVYIHIPFCPSKCLYCDFTSQSGGEAYFDAYVAALRRHITTAAPDFAGYEVVTVFFGGGTPTVLSAAALGQILGEIKANFTMATNSFISVEANPETVDGAYLTALLNKGFNRLSLGVQSFDNRLLTAIGRAHDAQKAAQAVENAAKLAFDDINIDLIFALPFQTLADFDKTLNMALGLPITHISCYALTVEDSTPLAARQDLISAICDENDDRAMYTMAAQKLAAAGFEHYEISNWAKPGKKCCHNVGYWTGREYIGFGTAAHSFVRGKRFNTNPSLQAYIGGDFAPQSLEQIDHETAMSEFIILGLRLIDGISPQTFHKRFNQDIFAAFGGKIEALTKRGLIFVETDNIRLTNLGLDLSNQVFAEFI